MTPDFDKMPEGLIPAIIQDADTRQVLMLAYMNAESWEKTQETGRVWFFSRSRQRLWMKGESSGNVLDLVELRLDCDQDTILVQARPHGPVCHTGADTCFNEKRSGNFLPRLEAIIAERRMAAADTSYTAMLFQKGINAMAQKVGEEAVELIIEAKDHDDERFRNEAADLMFHFLVLLQAKGARLADVEDVLKARHEKASGQ